MAFTKVCMDYKLPFYFGGHPAISPLVYQIAKEYGGDFATNVKIYQSLWFYGQTPSEVNYYKNIVWTEKRKIFPKVFCICERKCLHTLQNVLFL